MTCHQASPSHTKLALHKSRIVTKMRQWLLGLLGLLFDVLRPPLFLWSWHVFSPCRPVLCDSGPLSRESGGVYMISTIDLQYLHISTSDNFSILRKLRLCICRAHLLLRASMRWRSSRIWEPALLSLAFVKWLDRGMSQLGCWMSCDPWEQPQL